MNNETATALRTKAAELRQIADLLEQAADEITSLDAENLEWAYASKEDRF